MSRRLDPYSLQLFVATADAGSLARAASNENIAPSALSRRIGDLEHAFGVPLLVRSAKGIELTDAGRIAYRRARELESGLESILRDVRSIGGVVSGRVRLFANASSVVGFLPERLKAFTAKFPLVSIELQERPSHEVVRACLDDIADAGVCAAADLPNGVDVWNFARDPLLVVLPKGHVLSKNSKLRFDQVVLHSLVLVQTGGALDRMIRERASAASLTIRAAVSVNSFDGVCRMVEAGLGIAIVPMSAVSAYAGSSLFVRRPLDEPWSDRQIHLIALRKSPRSPAVGALINALKA